VAKLFTASDKIISLLSKELLKGEIVAVPTETVYGLAAHAFDPKACSKVFEAKQRPSFDPLIVHLPLKFPLSEVAEETPLSRLLAHTFWPGPLTLVLKKKERVPDIVTAGLDSVAIRVPSHPILQRLLQACQAPLAAPSANPFGYVSPTTSQHVQESLGDRIPYILEGGPCEIGLESTILDVRNSVPVLLRPGALTREEIYNALGIEVALPSAEHLNREVMPGQLTRHYSPYSTCRLVHTISPHEPAEAPTTAFLFYQKPLLPRPTPPNIFWLCTQGSDLEAAQHLFNVLRQIDNCQFPSIVAEKAPPHGLGMAINDRLQRAAAKK
jgi:L-threonylcarbamoyladenylate synthase